MKQDGDLRSEEEEEEEGEYQRAGLKALEEERLIEEARLKF